MKHLALFLGLCLAAPIARAQHASITGHGFADAPALQAKVPAAPESIVVLHRSGIQNIVEEQGTMHAYVLQHSTVYLRDDAAIEHENKVYVDMDNVEDVVRMEARSIAPDGTVHRLDADDFKRATDEDERGSYLYFAYEGLVPGSIVDYYYVMKKVPQLNGDAFTLQLSVPILEEEFHLINPARLVYRSKSYMGAPEAVVDTAEADVQHLRWSLADVPALEDEPSANLGAARMRLAFKLDRVPDRGMKDVSGYIGATKLYYAILHQPLTGKAAKELKGLVGRMKLDAATTPLDKVRRAEDHLKTNFQVLSTTSTELSSVETILRTKVCSRMGMVALTSAVLGEMGVDHQFVITSDRTRVPFDKDFESYQFLDDMGLYLPGLGRYLDPITPSLRVGFLKSENMANHGLFIRSFDMGGTSTGVGSVKYIEPLPDSLSVHDHLVTARLSADATSATIDFETRMTGYFASIQCFYPLLNEEKKTEVRNNMLDYLLENGEVEDLRAENAESLLFGDQPFILKGRVGTGKFNAMAGDKVLFKVGELIGPQVEMYAEKPRKLPVDDDYNRRFERTIEVVLPAGWTVQSLDELNIDHHLDIDGERKLQFVSTATLEGDTVKLHVVEFYRQCTLPLDRFEAYRSVVNAAADYNKLALVLVKS